MDQSAGSFSSMSANLRKVAHTEVINDNTEESGTIILKKTGPKQLAALIDFTKPDPRTVTFRAKKAEVYSPKLNTVQEYDLSRYSDAVDQLMLAGFGTSGKDLAANYDVTLKGEEIVAGKKAARLQLIPKTAEKKEKLKMLELWIAEDGAYPVQQKLVQPSGDYNTFTYSDVKLNAPVPDAALTLKLPKGVKRVHPQK